LRRNRVVLSHAAPESRNQVLRSHAPSIDGSLTFATSRREAWAVGRRTSSPRVYAREIRIRVAHRIDLSRLGLQARPIRASACLPNGLEPTDEASSAGIAMAVAARRSVGESIGDALAEIPPAYGGKAVAPRRMGVAPVPTHRMTRARGIAERMSAHVWTNRTNGRASRRDNETL